MARTSSPSRTSSDDYHDPGTMYNLAKTIGGQPLHFWLVIASYKLVSVTLVADPQVATAKALGHEMASRQAEFVDCSLQGCALRLGPGEELKSRLKEIGNGRSLFVLSCVGSLSSVSLRLAGYVPDSGNSRGGGEGNSAEEKSTTPHETTNDVIHLNQHFEILSLVGTICR
eukprot:128040-Rhodomonas_salina.2